MSSKPRKSPRREKPALALPSDGEIEKLLDEVLEERALRARSRKK